MKETDIKTTIKKEIIDGQPYKNESLYGVSIYIMQEQKIALSEMSFIEKDMAKGYIDMVKDKTLQTIMKSLIEEDNNGILFYNRLNVPVNMRNNGYGKELLKETLKLCQEKNYILINCANNYGEMGQKNLIEFYKTGGMTLLHKDGLLAYHKDLESLLTKDNKKSLKKKI